MPPLASLLLALKFAQVVSVDVVLVQMAVAILLGGTVFAAIRHAEVLALRLGEPFGSILLAVAVTVIEVGLIAMSVTCPQCRVCLIRSMPTLRPAQAFCPRCDRCAPR